MHPLQSMLQTIIQGNIKSLARALSLVENEAPGYQELLKNLPVERRTPVIGITGAPGAGKSTLVDALIDAFVREEKKIGILCVDPSSPFNLGALLGDRIRMSEWYNHPNVFIRSLATRGSMGGLHPKIIELTDLMKAAPFDYILVETVGVGQTEVEIAGLADVTVVVVVPEGGDEVQTMKAGLMEIADLFVVNKADRPGADEFVRNLRSMLMPSMQQNEIAVVKTVASTKEGVDELVAAILKKIAQGQKNERATWLLTEKAYQLIQHKRMKEINKENLRDEIEKNREAGFNLYRFIEKF